MLGYDPPFRAKEESVERAIAHSCPIHGSDVLKNIETDGVIRELEYAGWRYVETTQVVIDREAVMAALALVEQFQILKDAHVGRELREALLKR